MAEFGEALLEALGHEIAAGRTRVAILGLGEESAKLLSGVRELGCEADLFDPDTGHRGHPLIRDWSELADGEPQILVIASDVRKEELLRAAARALGGEDPLPRVLIVGLGHQESADTLFEELEAPALVTSYATGHPHTRRHIYDCLREAGAKGRRGAIVELGAFKGGTTVWLARAAAGLGLGECPVIGFDSWEGFPPRRSLLDLYEHPRCVFTDLEAVRNYTAPFGIELVAGDIAETAPKRLAEESVLLAFVDTDNYSGARRALQTILPNLVAGGSIVFDHYFTTEDYVYTLGERMAADDVLGNAGLLHLHGTGVFVNVP